MFVPGPAEILVRAERLSVDPQDVRTHKSGHEGQCLRGKGWCPCRDRSSYPDREWETLLFDGLLLARIDLVLTPDVFSSRLRGPQPGYCRRFL